MNDRQQLPVEHRKSDRFHQESVSNSEERNDLVAPEANCVRKWCETDQNVSTIESEVSIDSSFYIYSVFGSIR